MTSSMNFIGIVKFLPRNFFCTSRIFVIFGTYIDWTIMHLMQKTACLNLPSFASYLLKFNKGDIVNELYYNSEVSST